MSHIHLPDGVLPTWLWVSGFLVTILLSAILFRSMDRTATRRLPVLGMMAAAMVLGASIEIIPIAYHINLTVISGILLGPSLIFLATFVVNVILALFGHGGITVIGLNTLTLAVEGVLGCYLFRILWRVSRKLILSTFLATFLALFLSTLAMIGVVSLGVSHYEELIHYGERRGIIGFELIPEKDSHLENGIGEEHVHLERFVAVILSLGFVGWLLESMITSFIIRYIHRLRPDLLRRERESP